MRPGVFRLVWKHHEPPVPSAFGRFAAELAAGAAAQGRFWELYELVFRSRATVAQLDHDGLLELAKKAGVDLGRFERESTTGAFRRAVERDEETARRLGLALPSVLVNGVRLHGVTPDQIDRAIVSELERGVQDRLRPSP
jgi:protein-disulfide isomerase